MLLFLCQLGFDLSSIQGQAFEDSIENECITKYSASAWSFCFVNYVRVFKAFRLRKQLDMRSVDASLSLRVKWP